MHALNIASVLTKMTSGELRNFICNKDLNLIKKNLKPIRTSEKKTFTIIYNQINNKNT